VNKPAVILAALEQLARTRAPQKWLLWMGTASMVRCANRTALTQHPYPLISQDICRDTRCRFDGCNTVQVAKPVFSFPLHDYAAKGHDIVVRGKLDKILEGDAWGAFDGLSSSCLEKYIEERMAPHDYSKAFWCSAALDSQIMLVHNTLWSRRFFRRAAQLFESPAELEEVCYAAHTHASVCRPIVL
jgi:hypothetical protein